MKSGFVMNFMSPCKRTFPFIQTLPSLLILYHELNPESTKKAFDDYLKGLIPEEPRSLYDPVRASLESGGKRLRPFLTALSSNATQPDKVWLSSAAAVELLHTFTLVHDDIMDNAPTRRSKPTIHAKYGRDAAILSGDVIVALALEALASSDSDNAQEKLREFAIGFRCVCEGQALDKDFESRDTLSLDEYLHMIEMKTSRIFELAAVLGALCGPREDCEHLRAFARDLGLAFQVQDDILDLTGSETFGKTIGGDVLEGKRTVLYVFAMQKYDACDAVGKELLDKLRSRSATAEDIAPMREFFEKLGVIKDASSIAKRHTEQAEAHLLKIKDKDQQERLRDFARQLLGRAT